MLARHNQDDQESFFYKRNSFATGIRSNKWQTVSFIFNAHFFEVLSASGRNLNLNVVMASQILLGCHLFMGFWLWVSGTITRFCQASPHSLQKPPSHRPRAAHCWARTTPKGRDNKSVEHFVEWWSFFKQKHIGFKQFGYLWLFMYLYCFFENKGGKMVIFFLRLYHFEVIPFPVSHHFQI